MAVGVFYNAAGGCIAGECMALMADGTHKRIDQIAKGDKLATTRSECAEVECVVALQCAGGRMDLVSLPCGLKLTPYHPIMIVCTKQTPFCFI